MPGALAARGIAVRGETPEDEPFLKELYESVRQQELADVLWPDAVKAAFLQDQFRLQRSHYLTHYQNSDFGIITEHGAPIGRLYLSRGTRDLRIVDISLSPEARRKGTGTALLRAVLAEAAAGGQIVSIHVEQFNPAQALYRRLGFVAVATDGPYWRMECRPEIGRLKGAV